MKYLIITIVAFICCINSCFAVSQKLVDGSREYTKAVLDAKLLQVIIDSTKKQLQEDIVKLNDAVSERNNLNSHGSSNFWRDDGVSEFLKPIHAAIRIEKKRQERLEYEKNIATADEKVKWYQDSVKGTTSSLSVLNAQYAELSETIIKLEPIKDAYKKQIKREMARDQMLDTLFGILGIVIILIVFFLILHLFHSLTKRAKNKYDKLLSEGKITKAEYDAAINELYSEPKFIRGINASSGLPLTAGGTCDIAGNPRGSSGRRYSYDSPTQEFRYRHRYD